MNKILRRIGLAAAVTASVGMGSAPASAEGAGAFTGTANINCFGCGVSSGTADLCVTGYVLGQPVVGVCITGGRNATATYTVTEIPSQCPVTGSATGVVTGAVNVSFSWTRIGETAVITTTGDIDGGGTAKFAVTSPVGNPCGGPVTASFAGAVAGT